MTLRPIIFAPLAGQDVTAFCCGEDALDCYLRTQASQDARRGFASVILAVFTNAPHVVIGYYTLSATSVALTALPDALRKKLPRYGQVPAALLGRLAVAHTSQGQGVGALLLADALHRAYHSALAWHLFCVRAKDDTVATFYTHFGFTSTENAPHFLWLTRHEVRKLYPV